MATDARESCPQASRIANPVQMEHSTGGALLGGTDHGLHCELRSSDPVLLYYSVVMLRQSVTINEWQSTCKE